jgi:hypothetical protein
MIPRRSSSACLLTFALIAGSAPRVAGAANPSLGAIAAIESPAGPHSGEPALAVAPDGAVWMSWLEKRDRRFALRVASCSEGKWSNPRTVAESDSFFVNWADTPSLAALGGGRLVVAWPWKHGGADPYAYDLRVATSTDGGETWSRPTLVHRDGLPAEHGFVSLVPAADGVEVVWLDGRKSAAPKVKPAKRGHSHAAEGEMSVRGARLLSNGTLAREVEIDGRVCDCCNTAAVPVRGGVLVAYRDRDAREIRDISVARLEGGRWSAPAILHRDGWKIAGCPVNGPALDAAGDRVVAAWFALAESRSRVRAAFSRDGGRSFGPALDVSSTDPLGRVDACLLDDGSALVSWFEAQGQDAFLRVQRISPVGPTAEPVTVAITSAARASGFPRMARAGDRVFFAWTETGDANRVRTSSARVP